MGSPAITITPDQQPQAAGGVTITPDKPGSRGFLSGLWDSTVGGAKNLFSDWNNAGPTVFDRAIDAQVDEGKKAVANAKQGEYSQAAGHGLAAVTPGFGPAAAKAGEDIGSGNTGYGLGEGTGTLLTALAPELRDAPVGRIAKTAGKVVGGTIEDIPGVRQAGKLAQYWKETAPKPTYPGAPEPATPPTELTQASSLSRGSSSPSDPAAGLGQIPRGSIAAQFKDPGAPLPETPDPNLGKASSLLYGPKPVGDPAAGLGTIPVRPGSAGSMAESVQPPIQRGSISQMMKQLQPELEKGLGASPPPNPKQPIYQRGSLANSMQEGSSDMPEGHTAHTGSSALRSSMYDSGAKEFHARMTSGDTTYVYGDVSPEEADAFNNAESKGKGYQQIKSGHPLVAKIVNGKRVSVKPTQ